MSGHRTSFNFYDKRGNKPSTTRAKTLRGGKGVEPSPMWRKLVVNAHSSDVERQTTVTCETLEVFVLFFSFCNIYKSFILCLTLDLYTTSGSTPGMVVQSAPTNPTSRTHSHPCTPAPLHPYNILPAPLQHPALGSQTSVVCDFTNQT